MKKPSWELGHSSQHLPVDLWMKILCFLPVKSLLVVRAVSKLLLSIINDSNFVSLHLHSFPANLNETLTLVRSPDIWSCKLLYKIRESNGIALPGKLDPGLRPFQHAVLIGSLDGLLLLKSDNGYEPDKAWLWNPSIRKIRPLLLPKDALSNKRYMGMGLLGLALDSSSQDHKVLFIAYDCIFRESIRLLPLGVWVYGLTKKSWTEVDMECSGICTDTFICLPDDHWPVFFQGRLFWIEGLFSENFPYDYSVRMAQFDMRTNKFGYHTKLPVIPNAKHLKMESRLVRFDGGLSLGLCGLDALDQVSLWAVTSLDGDGEASWVRRCVISDYPVTELFVFRTFGCVSKNDELMWKYDTGMYGVRRIVTYNLRTHRCEQSEIRSSGLAAVVDHPCAYVQSLIKL